jgi:SHS family lactate transporter-like MFS transporter
MSLLADIGALEKRQKSAILASYLGWTLDAFDFFLLVFLLKAISAEFGTDVKSVAYAIFLTLAARPFGALFFGLLADRFGRRPILIVVILAFSFFSALSGLAGSLSQLILIRTLFGFAMGGEWGIGASLVMETIPPKMRGPVSGLLQSGYPSGYFVASLVYFALFDTIGWRGMFFVGIAPALLVFLIRMKVEESPAFVASRDRPRVNPFAEIARNWKIALYMILLMAAFNAYSHGSQDLYPTFLQEQHGFGTKLTGTLTAIMNVGAIAGGICFGIWSEKIGRRRAIIAATLLSLPIIPLWAFTSTPLLLGIGAFLMQFALQGAWGIVPVHLNELSPGAVRAMFPGFAYQLGNLLMAKNAVFQAGIAEDRGGDYGFALALFAGITALLIAVWTAVGPERKSADLSGARLVEE